MAQVERKTSHSLAVFALKDKFKPWEFELNPLGDNDVEIRITHSGVCHSDYHTISGEWGAQELPLVPGHEIIGTVTAVGPKVSMIQVGQTVGVGPQAYSCGVCKYCLLGETAFCSKGFIGSYGNKLPNGYITKGGYALYHRTDERFAFPIPANLDPASTAPILCAGVTTFTPLRLHNVGKDSKVGVIGIGGLGHMGLQFARAMGAHVTAISSSPSKIEEAKSFGAHDFIDMNNADEMKAAKEKFDIILNTASVQFDFDKLINLVAPKGTFVQLGAPPGKVSLNAMNLIMRGRSYSGSLVGSPPQFKEMLELCSKHNIKAAVELFPWDQVEEAYKKLLNNSLRYRAVLVMPKEDIPAKL